ncbi:hypothetical protein QQP08_005244 [Theobroma cacao]|nr:hypothetical protein QQP08_005244 [Theobroma cacao]
MAMERLRRATEVGDIDELYNSIGEDTDVLRRYDDAEFADTPLHGYIAFHYVVENENLELLAQFLKDCPACIEDVTIQKKTALHITIEKHRFEALEILVRWLEKTHLYGKVSRKHLLNAKDTDGNTILFVLAIFTLSLTIAILQRATSNSTIAILAEVLTVLVIRSFYHAWWTIRPTHDIYVYSKDPDEAALAIFLITLACMEASRWFFIISKRLYLNHQM